MRFRDDYDFLSNFYPCKITMFGIEFNTVENAYVSCKTTDTDKKRHIATLTPGQAKRYGRKLELLPDWDSVKIGIMLTLLRLKFADPTLATRLTSIDEPIVEDNTWGDRFWGVYEGGGRNELGKLLEIVRNENRPASRRSSK